MISFLQIIEIYKIKRSYSLILCLLYCGDVPTLSKSSLLVPKENRISGAHTPDLNISKPVRRAAYLRAAIRRPQTGHSLQRPVRICFGLSFA